MKVYDKLVRDNIAKIICNSGKTCQTRTLGDEEYLEKLKQKLTEEVTEYLQSGEVEELADITEVVLALAKAHGCTPAQLEQIRREKCEKNGAFNDKVLLQWVKEK